MSEDVSKPDEQSKTPEAPKAPKPNESKAQQAREDEYRRTGRVPKGYVFNVYRGVHKRGS